MSVVVGTLVPLQPLPAGKYVRCFDLLKSKKLNKVREVFNMKLTMKLLVLFFGVLMLANIANAESPREQFRQMVGQLQKNPADDAMREKIIKLAHTIKPAPAVPEEAERFEGRAQFAFKNAKSPADYLDAAKEYEKAIAAAPWVPGYYADLCTIYEKAEKYAEAKKSCEFFLASSPSAQDASDVRKRIAGLEFAIEKVGKGQEFLKKLDGARFVRRIHTNFMGGGWSDEMELYEIRGNRAVIGTMTIDYGDMPESWGRDAHKGELRWPDNNNGLDPSGYQISGREFVIPKNDHWCQSWGPRCFDQIQTISEDGSKITERRFYGGRWEEQIYLREK